MRILFVAILLLVVTDHCHAQAITIESAVVKLLDEAELATQEAGLLTRVLVTEGQRVRRGEVLATVDSRQAELIEAAAKIELALAQAEAENDVAIRFAEKAREVAEAELARSQDSIAQFPKSISQSQLDVESLTVQKLMLEIEQAQHERALNKLRVAAKETELRAARLDAQRRQIESPIDGTVVEVRASVGEWVEPGESLVRVVSIDRVKVEGFVTASDAATLAIGGKASLQVPNSQLSFTGKLAFVSPEIDPINNQVRVWAEVENLKSENGQMALRPGESVTLRLGE